MNESTVLADRTRVLVTHSCGFRLVAYPITTGRRVRAGFAAQGQTVDHCPKCRADLRMSWEEMKTDSAAAFRL